MITIALVICLIGAVVYAVAEGRTIPAFVAELGRLSFFCGLLAYLLGK